MDAHKHGSIAARMFTWSGARSVEGMPPFSTMSQYHDCSGTTQTCPPTSSGAVRTPCALHCSLIALNFEIESCHRNHAFGQTAFPDNETRSLNSPSAGWFSFLEITLCSSEVQRS